MRMYKFLALFSVIAIVFTIALSTATQAEEFRDVGGVEQRAAIEFLQNNGVVKGYSDGTFKPENKISRAEFLKIVMNTASLKKEICTKTELQNIFPDVSSSDWFAQVVCDAKKTGIIKGHADGLFRPYNTIEISEAAKILTLAQEVDIDVADSGPWYKKYIDALEKEKAVKDENIQNPGAQISRGQMADMTWRIQTGNEILPEGTLPVINSCEDLSHQLKKNERRNGNLGGINIRRTFSPFGLDEAVMEDSAPQTMMAKTSSVSANQGASSDFSTTNIQELGVDEADIIKNDGSHIFYARGEDVRIIKAYPIGNFAEESKISVQGMQITELFLDNDTLTVLGRKINSDGGIDAVAYAKIAADSIPYYRSSSGIEMRVFDVSDRSNPKEIRKVSLDGNMISTRKIGDIVYIVSQKYLRYEPQYLEKNLPVLLDGDEENSVAPKCGNIEYFPNFKNSQLLTVAAIDTNNTDKKITLKNILGAGNTVYASPKNLYVVQQNTHQVYRSLLSPPRWDWDEKSDIYKFSLDGVGVDFVSHGSVDGQVLNQYSMSEYEGNFRIATQKGRAWGQKLSENMVTLLDSHLKEISAVRNIAPGENLKSARFMGKRAFIVTFKNVDPLFVLDLDPKNPKILGKLKIPGWSDYLHPIDDNYLIGFGKEVDETIDADKIHSDNAVYFTAVLGMKLAIFDVSDLKNPKEVHKTVIGDRGTESEILHNPKALFYDASRKLIGFPIRIQTKSSFSKDCSFDVDGQEICEDNASGDKFETTFVGAQVYNFSLETGFSLKGQVSHFPTTAKNFWDRNYTIERIVRIGDNFYSASKGLVKALDTNFKEQSEVSFMGDTACENIFDEYSCRQNENCTVEYAPNECPVGKLCTQVMEFERCVGK